MFWKAKVLRRERQDKAWQGKPEPGLLGFLAAWAGRGFKVRCGAVRAPLSLVLVLVCVRVGVLSVLRSR